MTLRHWFPLALALALLAGACLHTRQVPAPPPEPEPAELPVVEPPVVEEPADARPVDTGELAVPSGDMPFEITERLWHSPGPAQDAPDAPRLLIVFPRSGEPPVGGVMRYAGRVEPETATVRLNGEELRIWPGGVFTGTRSVPEGAPVRWRFVAEHEGGSTTVEREVHNPAPRPAVPPTRRPLAFAASPVSPTGEWWLPAGRTLRVTLWASADAVAEVRVGSDGPWQPMQAGESSATRGTRYTADIEPRATSGTPTAQQVHFRLRDPAGRDESRQLASTLRLGRVPDDPPLALVSQYRATFLKDSSGWERWGNWIEGTPFPVLEATNDRIRTRFGPGAEGWIEEEFAQILWDRPFGSLPSLPAPEVDQQGTRLLLRWPERRSPVAIVFDHQPDAAGDRLVVTLVGAGRLAARDVAMPAGGPFASLRTLDATASAPPRIELRMRPGEVVWGYETTGNPFAIEVRAEPAPANATPDRPLQGLRIMLDAGHGGPSSIGALGPSGLAEADLNLVQAAWVEHFLTEAGAQVRQTRRADIDVSLDDRVRMALAWDPDLFVSLHHNSVGMNVEPTVDSGPKVFYHYSMSAPIAREVAGRLAAIWPGGRPQALTEVFRVNRNITLCPSILVETAFVNNPVDEVRLRRTETHRDTARAIVDGIIAHFAR